MSTFINYLKDAYSEFRYKVEWPKWSDLQSSTIVVSVATLILALFTFGVDSLFSVALKNLFSLLISIFN